METTLDLRTMVVVLMLISFALSAVMIYVLRSSKSYDGFGWWTAGTTAATLTFVVIGLIGSSAPILTATLSSAAGTGSLITAYLGIRRFFGRSMPYRTTAIIWSASIFVPLLFLFVYPNAILRITIISMLVAVIAGASAYEFRAEGDSESRRVYRVARWSYGLFTTWMVARSLINIVMPDAFGSNAGQGWTMAVYIVYNVFWTFNYLILNNQRLRQDLERAKSDLERQATTDFLTGVPNDRSFFETGEKEFSRAVRFRYPLSVVMMDLDGFKEINDRFGHAKGDEVLKSVVNDCRAKLRSSDTFARLGGDEFALLLAFTTSDNARIVAEVLRETIAGTKAGPAAGVTCSFGIAEIADTDTDIKCTLDRADKNLYEAKRLGRNRVVGGLSDVRIEVLMEA